MDELAEAYEPYVPRSRLVVLTAWDDKPVAFDRYSVISVEYESENQVAVVIQTATKEYTLILKGDVVPVAQQIDPDLKA